MDKIDDIQDKWMHLLVTGPPELITKLVKYLQYYEGFSGNETDWCGNERRTDFALYSYGPARKPNRSRYEQ